MSEVALRTVLFAALVGLAFAPLERLFGAAPPRREATATDVAFASAGMVLTRIAVVFGLGAVLSELGARGLGRPIWGFIEARALRTLAEVATGLLLFELAGYVYHRLAHQVPALWRLHRVHHSTEHMDWLASFRQHPLETVLMTLVQNVPLVLLHIPLGSHAAVLLLLRVHTVFVHANLRVPVGWWSGVLAMPRFHHRHHARRGAARNFSSAFPWLDRVFGTYCAGTSRDFGVLEPAPRSFLGLLAWPLR